MKRNNEIQVKNMKFTKLENRFELSDRKKIKTKFKNLFYIDKYITIYLAKKIFEFTVFFFSSCSFHTKSNDVARVTFALHCTLYARKYLNTRKVAAYIAH